MHSRCSSPSVFILIALSCTFSITAAQSSSPSPTVSVTPPPSPSPKSFRVGRLFHISSEGFMTQLLNDDTDFVKSTATIQRHASHVEAGISRFLREKRAPPANQSLHPCNSDGRGYIKSMRNFVTDHGLSEPDMTCLTVFEGVHNEMNSSDPWLNSSVSEDDVYSAIITRADSMYDNRIKIADKILGNWTTPDVNIHYLYNTTSKRCKINHVGAMRSEDNWYIFTTVTNKPRRKSVPLWQRQWLTEYIHALPNASGLSAPLNVTVPIRPLDSDPPDTPILFISNSTTILGTSGGFAGPYAFNSMYPEENPALVSAMDKSDLAIQQADDALAPSSLAILLLPLALNMIPLALISESATTKKTLAYALLTDVATVVPLAIKGIELIHIGRQTHRSVVMRISASISGDPSPSAAMELWGAECRARSDVLPAGIAFLLVALLFLLIGVVLELFARAYIIQKTTIHVMQSPSMMKRAQNTVDSSHSPLTSFDPISVSPRSEEGGQFFKSSASKQGWDKEPSKNSGDRREVVDVTDQEIGFG